MLGPLLDIKINNTLVTRANFPFLPPHAMHEAVLPPLPRKNCETSFV